MPIYLFPEANKQEKLSADTLSGLKVSMSIRVILANRPFLDRK